VLLDRNSIGDVRASSVLNAAIQLCWDVHHQNVLDAVYHFRKRLNLLERFAVRRSRGYD
jgi:hypothetical protein